MAVLYTAKEAVKSDPNAPKLAIGIPTRNVAPIEFTMAMLQAINPLNVKTSYIIQRGMLPAEARNSILSSAIEAGSSFVLFLDDDVLFPDIAFYRMWIHANSRPEAGVITGVYTTKLEPTEPFLYDDESSGAYWDWPLGALVPIHSAGAGFMMVNVEHAKKMSQPWFDDQILLTDGDSLGRRRSLVGQDRYFMARMRDEVGAEVYADTGLLLIHWDRETSKPYFLPPTAPCFQRPILGDAFVPFIRPDQQYEWRRLITSPAYNEKFKGYLDWLSSGETELIKLVG